MKIFLILIVIFISLFIGCIEEQEIIEKAIDFTLIDIDGNTFNLSNYNGKIVLINFFATWCEPCKLEMTDLFATYEKYGDKIIMISIDVDETESLEKIRGIKENYTAEWIFARDTIEESVEDK